VVHAVTCRVKEIAVRLALGAHPNDVVKSMMAHAGRPVIAGLVVGVSVAAGLMHAISPFLLEVRADDPVVFAACAFTLALVATTASYVPARRAVRLEPTKALRAD
jgi:putative ABC transport system permease protein